MSATSILQSIQSLQSNIFKHVRHRALLQNLGAPTLKDIQLFFIQLPFLNGERQHEGDDMSAITTGIVHASLLEHEKIREVDATSKNQQLMVLSGDYYSGRYYQLLAHSENILLIQKLSQGILTRCEHQIKLYEEEQRSVTQWIESLTVIECELIARYYEVLELTTYETLMNETLTYVRLNEEIKSIGSEQPGLLVRALKETMGDEAIKEELIEQRKIRYEQLQRTLQNATLKQSLKQYIEQEMLL